MYDDDDEREVSRFSTPEKVIYGLIGVGWIVFLFWLWGARVPWPWG